MAFCCLSALFLLYPYSVAAALTYTGQTLILNDIPYYVPATPFVTIPSVDALKSSTSADGLVPVTVVALPSSNSNLNNLGAITKAFGTDDVWNEGFLDGMSERLTCLNMLLHEYHVSLYVAEPNVVISHSAFSISHKQ